MLKTYHSLATVEQHPGGGRNKGVYPMTPINPDYMPPVGTVVQIEVSNRRAPKRSQLVSTLRRLMLEWDNLEVRMTANELLRSCEEAGE